MKQKKIENITLGAFEVSSDKLVISDPCYNLGTWCMGTVPNVKPGLWTASIGVANTGEFGERIAFLAAFHQVSPSIQKLKACPASFDVGVDSGQAGLIPYGVVSSSGLGDGCYCCYYYTDWANNATSWSVIIDSQLTEMRQIMQQLLSNEEKIATLRVHHDIRT